MKHVAIQCVEMGVCQIAKRREEHMTISKMIRSIVVVLLSGCIVFSSVVRTQAAVSTESIGAGAALVSDAVVEAYEASVISEMAGRAGSSTVQGAKGIAFEIIYKDLKNLENFICVFKPTERFALSLSSTDEVADLIVTNKDASVIRLIQCKDGTSVSQIRKILQQVMDGKYADASLVGTKECAAEFNRLAAAKGIDAKMIDSGISTELTKKIAEKAVGGKIATLVKSASKSAKAGGVLCGAVSAIASVINGDTVPQTVGNVSIDALNGYLASGGAALAGELVTMGFAAFEAPAIVTTAGVFAATIATGCIIMAGLEKISNVLELKKQVAKAYDTFLEKTGSFLADAEVAIGKFGESVAEKTSQAADAAGKALAKTGDYLGSKISGWFKKG